MKRCSKGKSCGATCISSAKRCILELGESHSSSLRKVVNLLESRQTQTEKPAPAQLKPVSSPAPLQKKAETKPKPETKIKEKPAEKETLSSLRAKGKALMAEYNKLNEQGKFAEADKKIKKALEVNKKIAALASTKAAAKIASAETAAKAKASEQDQAKWKEAQDKRDKAQLSANLNSKQKLSIKQYTDEDMQSGYKQLNECMRIPSLCSDKKWAAQFAKNLDNALDALPKNAEGDTFYRGVWAKGGPARDLYYALENAKPGQKITDPGFGSYTSRQATAKDFYSDSSPSILFRSKSKRLTPVNMYSELPSEYEAILPRGTRQTIRSVTKQGELLIVDLD